jgi:hypothetical protein
MTKQNKNLLMIGGALVVGYLIYQNMKKKPTTVTTTVTEGNEANFSNARGIVRPRSTEYNSTWCDCNGTPTKCILGATGTCADCCGIAAEPKSVRL